MRRGGGREPKRVQKSVETASVQSVTMSHAPGQSSGQVGHLGEVMCDNRL